MRTEHTAWALRRNAAIVLLLSLGYLLATAWIYDAWSVGIAFAAVFGVAAAIAIRVLRGDLEVRTSWLLIPLAAIVLWGPAQLAAGTPEYRFEVWQATLTWAAVLALYWSALQVFSPLRLANAFRVSAIVFGAVAALEAVLQLFSGDVRVYGVVTLENDVLPMGSFQNRDHFCALMELILPLALWTGIRNQRRAWIYFTVSGVMYASVIASASRAGAVIATLEVILLLIVGIVRRRARAEGRSIRMAVAVAVLVAIGGGVVGWSPVLDRFQLQDLFLYRREFLESTLRMIHDRPWFGFGLGSWPWVYPRYAIIDPVAIANHAHNDWVEWAANGGIPFAALIALIALRAFWLSLELPWGIGTVAVFAHAAVDFPLARPPLLLAVMAIIAALEIEWQERLGVSAVVEAAGQKPEAGSEAFRMKS